MYDLFVLGELMTEGTHGYVLQERLTHAVGPIRRISSGTLYPLLSRFVKKGWISLQLGGEQQRRRQRKIYELTTAGRERFLELMAEPIPISTDAELMFHFKMAYFQYVTKEVQLACLKQYLEYLHVNLRYVNAESQMIRSKQIPEQKRIQLLRMFDHRRHVAEADIAWVRQEIDRIKTPSD
ncbi:PadR family transcriptional regulator [Brevibacillus humidisoli]|uniref:PadR family transcriptional regulator n=1 Tax=Brevibacillus humidisoli TaxID=2895522 RepID=UPI001E4D0758|nr:PadR family transcriptional regulator [Brevibacillus humidisoli]UFJ42601.1 PadR family transcriptional regulator [Brevibacillus humidisoli]